MKIGILYIGVGRYVCFWPDFYKSCEQYLVPEAEKHYYVFTDKDDLEHGERVSVYHQDDMGWPCNSLFRFKMFRRIKEELKDNDYLFFFNSNAQVVSPVTAADLLPEKEEFAALCLNRGADLGFEKRPESAACVPQGPVRNYYSGALNGGKCSAFIQLIEACDDIADTDLRNGLMPVWHDESVLNGYLQDKEVKAMTRVMGKPANWKEPKGAKIILRTKESVLGRGWLRRYKGREHTNTWLRKLLRKIGVVK